MDFYSTAPATKPIASNSGQINPSQAPGANLNSGTVGNLTIDQLGTGQWGTGQSLAGAGREQIMHDMQNSTSKANPGDYANMDALRSYYSNALSDLPGATQNKASSYDSQMQRGTKNLMSQYTNSQAGTGSMGSRQFAGAQGDIYAKAASDYSTGLINARSQAINQARAIQGGMSGVQNQDLQERQFQMEQGQAVSDMIYKLMGLDQGYQAQQAAISQFNRQMDMAKIQQISNPGGLMAGSSMPASTFGGSGAAAGGAGGSGAASGAAAGGASAGEGGAASGAAGGAASGAELAAA